MRDILYTARFDCFRYCALNFAYNANAQLRAFISSPANHSSALLHRLPAAGRMRLKSDGTRAETRFCLSAKRTSPFKSAGASVQSTNGSRGGRISGSDAGYTMFRGSVKGTGSPLHSPVSLSLPLPCGALYHHVSTGLY